MDRMARYEYELPEELIAQQPLPRGSSRLLVLNRASGRLEDRVFRDIVEFVHAGDVLVVNDTRVSARRYAATDPQGRQAEVLLIRPVGEMGWEALVYPGKRLKPGTAVILRAGDLGDVQASIVQTTSEGGRIIEVENPAIRDALKARGEVPLPPYIRSTIEDEDRYQTVYAFAEGSAAAPTAGLHFTEELLGRIRKRGAAIVPITLHVGVDTFRPVRVEDPAQHKMHGEWFTIGSEAATLINQRRGKLIAVGTTVVRALETVADASGQVHPTSGLTKLFIRPGHRFRAVEALLTNFHLPRSTLLMLVCAFAGYESTMRAYRHAVTARYRFYSFGDAMLIR